MAETSERRCRTCGTPLAHDNPSIHCAVCARRTSGPPTVSPEFWDFEGFREPFRAKHIGRVIRAYRHHPGHYRVVPQHRVGEWLGLTQAQLSRIENGPRITDLTRLVAWAATLGIPTSRLWFASHAATTDGAHAQEQSTSVATRETVDVAGPVSSGGDDDVRRSEFLAAAGGTLAGLLAPPLVHGWQEEQPVPPPRLDEELLMQLRVQNEGFRWRDRQEGARQLLPHTSRYAHRVTQFWQATPHDHPLRRALGQLAADACHLVAYQTFDQGDRVQAAEWYRSAAELAARTADQGMYVFAMCGVSYMHSRQGRDDLAFNVLRQLAGMRLAASERCHVFAYEAYAHAAAGSRDGAVRALDVSRANAESAATEMPSPWYGLPDCTWVDRQSANVLARLGDPSAVDLLQRLGATTPSVFQRYQVTLLSTLGLAYAQAGDVEAATHHLTEALLRNKQTRSAEKTNIAVEARRVLPTGATTTTVVRELDDIFRLTGTST